MLDTVNFRLTQAEVEGVDFLCEIPPHLNPESVAFHDYRGEQIITGTLNGLKVSVSNYQVRVGNGSLCKYLLGDNFQSMGRGDVQRAVERLSDELHLPMARAQITRIDVAENIIIRHPIHVYLNHLGVLTYANRLLQPDSLYYVKRDQILCFYDKLKEQRAKKEPIPELYTGQNVLRYEQRYTQRLPSKLGVPKVTGGLLFDEAFYMKLLNRWRDTYQAIQKINDVTLNFAAMNTKRQLYQMGLLSLIERAGGQLEMIAQINEPQKQGKITLKQAFDLRQAVNEACQVKEGLTVPNEAIQELDKKVIEAVKFYR